MLACYQSPTFKHYNIFTENEIAKFTATAPSPRKDFYYLQILKDKIVWRGWRITSRNEAEKYTPSQITSTYFEFKKNGHLRGQIHRIMGKKVLRFCDGVVNGQLDFLARMPPLIIEKILEHVNAEDIVNLGNSCKSIFEICNKDDVWRNVYCRNHKEPPSDVIEDLARTYSWKRVFFMNKLKLQMQIRRLKMEQGKLDVNEAYGDTLVSLTSGGTYVTNSVYSKNSTETDTSTGKAPL